MTQCQFSKKTFKNLLLSLLNSPFRGHSLCTFSTLWRPLFSILSFISWLSENYSPSSLYVFKICVEVCLFKWECNTIYSNNFQLVNRNVNPIILKNGEGKNSLFIIQGTIEFPHSRLSSHSKKKFPHSRLRRSWGNFSLLFLLSLSWGNSIVPFMIHREFLFPLLAPSAPRRGNIPSPFFKMMGLGHSY